MQNNPLQSALVYSILLSLSLIIIIEFVFGVTDWADFNYFML